MASILELDVIDPTVTCTDCGRCCLEMNSAPFVLGYEEDQAWFDAAPQEARDIWNADDDRPDGSPCSWLDPVAKQCRFHEFRPGICRDFPVGGESCLKYRRE